jgi:hypothetical protein
VRFIFDPVSGEREAYRSKGYRGKRQPHLRIPLGPI